MQEEEEEWGLISLVLLVIFIVFMFVHEANAEDEEILADAIGEVCNFSYNDVLSKEKEKCMIYYVNCVVGEGGKWTDKRLFECMEKRQEEKYNGSDQGNN